MTGGNRHLKNIDKKISNSVSALCIGNSGLKSLTDCVLSFPSCDIITQHTP